MKTNETITTIATTISDRDGKFEGMWMTDSLNSKVASARRQADRIRVRMEELIAQLDADGADANFNSLGEIQGAGSELDSTLGQIAAIRKVYEELASMATRKK